MIYYRPDGTKISEAENSKDMGDSLAFPNEEAAFKYFERKATDANKKANPGFFEPQGTADRAAHAYINLATPQGKDSGPNPNTQLEDNKSRAKQENKVNERVKLQAQLDKGQITEFEFKKALDNLDNPADKLFPKESK